ncbi:MAG: hypothetical protein M5U34_48370 [Chloroflexi bacterium]|nr:hypothetical protein [Chloroflexota bacterium]
MANADESEPGTFEDRVIMEEDPFSLIEAMTLMGYTIGAENGWILVRGEYPRSYDRLRKAIAKARAAGYLGRHILGRQGFHLTLKFAWERGRIFAVKRRRCLKPLRANGAFRASSRLIRPAAACSTSPPPSTMWKRW